MLYSPSVFFFTGLVAVETTVSVITEIMWTFACQSQQNLLVCVPHLIQLITAVVS